MCHHMIINDTHCNTLLSYLRDHIYRCGGPSAIVMVKVHHDAGTPCRQPVAMDDCISDISAGFDTVDYVILLDRLSKSFGITDSALFWFQSLLTDLLNFLLYFASLGFWVLPVLPGFTSPVAYPRVWSLLSFFSFCIPRIHQGSWDHWVSHPTNVPVPV